MYCESQYFHPVGLNFGRWEGCCWWSEVRMRADTRDLKQKFRIFAFILTFSLSLGGIHKDLGNFGKSSRVGMAGLLN